MQAVGRALQVLQLCAKAAQLIEGKQLYKAFKMLEAIQRDHGALLQGGSLAGYAAAALPQALAAASGGAASSREGTPHKTGHPSGSAAASGTAAAGVAEMRRPSSGGGGEQLGPLVGFLRDRAAELAAALEQRAIADFHNWLTSVRAQARVIGQRAVRWAASERQQEEQLARQRKLLLPRLEGLADLRAAGQLVAQSLQAPGVAEATPPTPLEAPPPVGTPAAAAAASPLGGGVPGADTHGAARTASFRAARQAASSPTRATTAAASGAAGSPADSPRGAASSSRAPAVATGAVQTPQRAQDRVMARPETFAATGARPYMLHAVLCCAAIRNFDTPRLHVPHSRRVPRPAPKDLPTACASRKRTCSFLPKPPAAGDLLADVDMTPLHRCLHIHACLGRMQQFTDYYTQNRRQQVGNGRPRASVCACRVSRGTETCGLTLRPREL